VTPPPHKAKLAYVKKDESAGVSTALDVSSAERHRSQQGDRHAAFVAHSCTPRLQIGCVWTMDNAGVQSRPITAE